jgi:2-(1,2-epoxy-1,2-dihydrophenyl)acetyl-CoA isomerase
MPYQTILVDREEGVVTLTLNRPDKLNSLDPQILDEAAEAIRELNDDDETKVLIITGAGRAFCSGADLTTPAGGTDTTVSDMSRRTRTEPFARFGRVMKELANFAKPSIAAVNGIAAGAGLAIALICDIRIASEDARFSCIWVRRGMVADCGTSFYLPRLAGVAKALELMWTGDIIHAKEAERIGLVRCVVPPENLMNEAREFALRLARGPSVAIELMKRMVYDGLKANDFSSQLSHEDFAHNVVRLTEDYQEGINSFIEKREPRFSGR